MDLWINKTNCGNLPFKSQASGQFALHSAQYTVYTVYTERPAGHGVAAAHSHSNYAALSVSASLCTSSIHQSDALFRISFYFPFQENSILFGWPLFLHLVWKSKFQSKFLSQMTMNNCDMTMNLTITWPFLQCFTPFRKTIARLDDFIEWKIWTLKGEISGEAFNFSTRLLFITLVISKQYPNEFACLAGRIE